MARPGAPARDRAAHVLADVKKQPPITNVSPPPSGLTPKPDLKVWIEGDGSIAVQNVGDANVNGQFVVKSPARCFKRRFGARPAAPRSRTASGNPRSTCRPLQSGSIKMSPGQQTLIQKGPGWAMLYPAVPSWAKGTYKFAATVDPAGVIQEKSKSNNGAAATVVN